MDTGHVLRILAHALAQGIVHKESGAGCHDLGMGIRASASGMGIMACANGMGRVPIA